MNCLAVMYSTSTTRLSPCFCILFAFRVLEKILWLVATGEAMSALLHYFYGRDTSPFSIFQSSFPSLWRSLLVLQSWDQDIIPLSISSRRTSPLPPYSACPNSSGCCEFRKTRPLLLAIVYPRLGQLLSPLLQVLWFFLAFRNARTAVCCWTWHSPGWQLVWLKA